MVVSKMLSPSGALSIGVVIIIVVPVVGVVLVLPTSGVVGVCVAHDLMCLESSLNSLSYGRVSLFVQGCRLDGL